MKKTDTHLSPARRAGLSTKRWSHRLTNATAWNASKFHCGMQVHAKVDPRHVGRVCAVFQDDTVRVQFPSGWKADFRPNELTIL